MHPSHARPELANCIDGKLHESQGSLHVSSSTRDVDGHEPTGNLFNRGDRQTSKVGSTDLGEESFHEESHSVQMSNYDQGVRRTMVVLEVTDRHPKEPFAKRLEALELLGNGKCRADLARTSKEANEMLNLSGIFLVVLEMCLNFLNLLEGALVSLQILRARLAGTMVLSRRWRGRRESAALGDKVSKLGFVLPWIHGIDHLHVCKRGQVMI